MCKLYQITIMLKERTIFKMEHFILTKIKIFWHIRNIVVWFFWHSDCNKPNTCIFLVGVCLSLSIPLSVSSSSETVNMKCVMYEMKIENVQLILFFIFFRKFVALNAVTIQIKREIARFLSRQYSQIDRYCTTYQRTTPFETTFFDASINSNGNNTDNKRHSKPVWMVRVVKCDWIV